MPSDPMPLKTNFSEIKAAYEEAHPLQRVGIVFYPFIFDIALDPSHLAAQIEIISKNIERTIGGMVLQAAGYRLACEKCETELQAPHTDVISDWLPKRDVLRFLCEDCYAGEMVVPSDFGGFASAIGEDGRENVFLRKVAA